MNKSIGIGLLIVLSLSFSIEGVVELNRQAGYVIINGSIKPFNQIPVQDNENKKVCVDDACALPTVGDEGVYECDDFFMVGLPQDQVIVRSPSEKHSPLQLFIIQWLVWGAVKAENSYSAVCSWKDRFLAWILNGKERK